MRCAGVPPRMGAVVPSAAHLPSLLEMVELQATYWQKLLDTVASGLPFAVAFFACPAAMHVRGTAPRAFMSCEFNGSLHDWKFKMATQ